MNPLERCRRQLARANRDLDFREEMLSRIRERVEFYLNQKPTLSTGEYGRWESILTILDAKPE